MTQISAQVTTYETNHEQLMTEWNQRHKGKGYKAFVTDGIVCPEEWFAQNDRVLFILKEAYSKDKCADDWCLTTHIADPEEGKGRIWTAAAEWQYAIANTTAHEIAEFGEGWLDDTPCDYEQYAARRIATLRKCAVVNIKKSNGVNPSDDEDLKKYVDEDWDLIKKQIEIINPTVIICGNTFHLLRDNPGEKVRAILGEDTSGLPEDNKKGIYRAASRTVISYYHPAVQYPAALSFYGIAGMYHHGLKTEE